MDVFLHLSLESFYFYKIRIILLRAYFFQ